MADADQIARAFLNKMADKLSYEHCQISLKSIVNNAPNYSSKSYVATISAKGKPDVDLFVKVGIVGEEARAVINMEIYAREFFFYDEVLKDYKYLEEKHNVPEQYTLRVAEYYGCNKDYLKEIIVLENLLKKNYLTQDRFISVDWDYACESVKQLAILHALSIVYSQEFPEKFANVSKRLEFSYPKNFFDKVVGNAVEVVKQEHRERLSAFLRKNLEDETYEKFYKPGRITALIHGDFRPSNLMHRVLKDGELEIRVLDFQNFQTGNPLSDLLYYMSNGSDEEFRKQYFHRLIEYYYDELCSALARFSLDPKVIYPRHDFEFDLKQILPFGLLIAIFTLPFVTVSSEDVPKVDDNFEQACLNINGGPLFAERLNGIVSDYMKMGVL